MMATSTSPAVKSSGVRATGSMKKVGVPVQPWPPDMRWILIGPGSRFGLFPCVERRVVRIQPDDAPLILLLLLPLWPLPTSEKTHRTKFVS